MNPILVEEKAVRFAAALVGPDSASAKLLAILDLRRAAGEENLRLVMNPARMLLMIVPEHRLDEALGRKTN